jgi:hypothetical protein
MRLSRPLSRRLLGAVALHGMVDFANPGALVAYPLCLTLPPRAVAPAFVVGSLYHFSNDVGFPASLLLHAALAVLPPRAAMRVLDVFFLFVHLPVLACRVRARPLSATLLVLGLLVGAVASERLCSFLVRDGDVVLSPLCMRVVAAHCLCW